MSWESFFFSLLWEEFVCDCHNFFLKCLIKFSSEAILAWSFLLGTVSNNELNFFADRRLYFLFLLLWILVNCNFFFKEFVHFILISNLLFIVSTLFLVVLSPSFLIMGDLRAFFLFYLLLPFLYSLLFAPLFQAS